MVSRNSVEAIDVMAAAAADKTLAHLRKDHLAVDRKAMEAMEPEELVEVDSATAIQDRSLTGTHDSTKASNGINFRRKWMFHILSSHIN